MHQNRAPDVEGLQAEAACPFPSALQPCGDGSGECTLERRSCRDEEEDVCQNNVPPGSII